MTNYTFHTIVTTSQIKQFKQVITLPLVSHEFDKSPFIKLKLSIKKAYLKRQGRRTNNNYRKISEEQSTMYAFIQENKINREKKVKCLIVLEKMQIFTQTMTNSNERLARLMIKITRSVYSIHSPNSIGQSQELTSRIRSILKDSLSQCKRLTEKKKLNLREQSVKRINPILNLIELNFFKVYSIFYKLAINNESD